MKSLFQTSFVYEAFVYSHQGPSRKFSIVQWCLIVTGSYYRYDEELVVPIIENTPEEKDLQVI